MFFLNFNKISIKNFFEKITSDQITLTIRFIVSIELNIETNGCKFLILTNNSIFSKIINNLFGWLLGFYDSTRDKDDTTVGVGHSRRYCNTGYDQSQGRRPSTLKCIGPISKGDIEPNHPSEINPNSDSRSRSDGRSRRFVQYRADQSQGQRPRSLLSRFPFLININIINIINNLSFLGMLSNS